jgi:hypothetical protein
MTFEEQMKIIEESWENHPITGDFLECENTRRMCSVSGVMEQIESIKGDYGIVFVATMNDGNIEIKQLAVHKQ